VQVSAPDPNELGATLGRFRDLQRRLEQAIPSTAVSIDGRTFGYRVAAGNRVPSPGDFVALASGDARHLGQIVTQELVTRDGPEVGATLAGESLSGEGGLDLQARVQVRLVEGRGIVLSGDGKPFVDASVEEATGAEIAGVARPRGDTTELVVGSVLTSGDAAVPARIDAGGFDRHTFLCGQSGSGKTYSLGLVLERLLLDTELRMVIIDPNSDFVRLRDARADADPAAAARLAALAPSILVRRPEAEGDERLRLRFPDLAAAAHAGTLRLDPVRDAEEYDGLLRAVEEGPVSPRFQALAAVAAGAPVDAADPLVRRVHNLGVDRWGVWARGQAGSVLEDLDRDDWRCLVVDIGTLGTAEERMLVSAAVLDRLWQKRHERRPLLVVIDEAHNVCPQLPESELQFLATSTAIAIAAEGRKFGLYLMLSTQRPQKVHENVVSQCDNLILMRMNSVADVGHLTELFSFVPPSLLQRATGFRLGEALVAGKIVPTPSFVRFGARVSEEGGSDVPADWARPRA
jgi:DNA helicase HerA-like ATPase